MISIEWDSKARDFLRKLPKETSQRIFNKIDNEVRVNPERFIETLVDKDFYKLRIGDYRLFVDYYKDKGIMIIRTIRHRKNAYKY